MKKPFCSLLFSFFSGCHTFSISPSEWPSSKMCLCQEERNNTLLYWWRVLAAPLDVGLSKGLGLTQRHTHVQPWQSAMWMCNEPNALSYLGTSCQARCLKAFQKQCHAAGCWCNPGGGWWATGSKELEASLHAHTVKNCFWVVLCKKSTAAITLRRKKALGS